MKRYGYIVTIFALFTTTVIHAQDITQTTNVSNELQTMFANLSQSSSRVPTGYLLDRAFEVINVHNFNGTTLVDSNYVDVNTLRNIILTINSSVVNSAGSTVDANTFIDNLADTTAVVLGAAAFKYNHIVSNALTDNLIVYQNGLVYDSYVNGLLQNPFGEDYVFAFAPNRSAISGNSVRFKFSSACLTGNLAPVSFEFDAGNGTGYQTISLPYDHTIQYLNTGEKELKMRIRLGNQTVLESHANLTLEPWPVIPAATYTQPDIIETFSGNYYSESVSAIVSIKYKTSGYSLTKPIIYAEGFDDPFLGALTIWSELSDSTINGGGQYFDALMRNLTGIGKGTLNFRQLYDKSGIPDSFKDQYDIVYVDWTNPTADIRANALLMEDIISWVNAHKVPNHSSRNIVMGHSMGGLVARYALRDMEKKGTPHEASIYVSHDSPHLGANVPLGVMYLIRDVYRLLYGEAYNHTGILKCHLFDGLLVSLCSILESTAARQMVYNYVTRDGSLDNSIHVGWQETLDSFGFPKGDNGFPIENLSIVNGGPYQNALPDEIMKLRVNIGNNFAGVFRILLGLATSMNNLNATFNVYRNSGGYKLVTKSVAKYDKEFLWIKFKREIPLISDSTHFASNGSLGLDVVEASTLIYSNSIKPNGADTVSLTITPPLPFIPTASALSVNDYSTHFANNPPSPRSATPFDSYALKSQAHIHMYDESEQWNWINDMANISISGPSGIAYNGDTFSLSGSASHYSSNNPQWISSNNGIATISSNGVLSVNSPGPVTLSFSDNSGTNYYYYKHRTILAGGLPSDLYLISTHISGNSHSVTAQCSSQQSNDLLDEMAGNGQIKYIWGIKNSTGNIAWSDTTSVRTVNITATNGTFVHMKIRDSQGRECGGESLFTTVSPFPIFLSGYSFEPEVVYTFQGSVWCVYDEVSDFGDIVFDPSTGTSTFVSSNYLMAWPDSSSPNIVPDRIIIDGQTIMLDNIIYQYINNTLTPVYCFKLLDSTYVQSVIANINSYPSQTAIVSGALYNGGFRIRRFSITFTKGLPPI